MSFDEFWAKYPRKVGKLAAQKAHVKALKVATAEEIDMGLKTFLYHFASKDIQFCPHPATWLNQGRWMDEYEESVSVDRKPRSSTVYDQERGWIPLSEYLN